MPSRVRAAHQLRNQLQIVRCLRGESGLASANLWSVLESLQDSLRLAFGPQMRILLDENFPADFATLLVGHDTSIVHGLDWAGIKNGELRRAHGVCEVFVTLDLNLEFQQNIKS